jgi:putative ubiquitin-RnfH superfamily antitoxin RatB of RatAB toxin-antitoxin module
LNSAPLRIEVAYAAPQRAIVKIFCLAPGASVADALRLAALDPEFSDVDVANSAHGIFGKVVHPDQTLKDGDRIEIYRPLLADPKVARRARARNARKTML